MLTGMKAKRPAPPNPIDIIRAFEAKYGHLIFVDWSEPACFACDYYQERWDTIAPWDEQEMGPTPDSVLNERWLRSRLQRAHLCAFQFDGSNDPDNFAMLCRRCHTDAPDTPNADVMVRWMVRREAYAKSFSAEVRAAAPAGLLERWEKAGSPAPDVNGVMDRAGVHWDSVYGAGMSLATLGAIGAEAIEAALSKEVRGQTRLLI